MGVTRRLLIRLLSWLTGIASRSKQVAGELTCRVSSEQKTHGEVTVQVHTEETLRQAAVDRGLEFESLSKEERAALAREVEPDGVDETTNTTVRDLHEFIVDVLDPGTSAASETVTHLAVGTDGSDATVDDSGLGNEVYRVDHRGRENRGRDLWTTTFLDTTEANGNTLREVGLVTDSSGGIFVNRALISEVVKNNRKTVTIDVTLKFREG